MSNYIMYIKGSSLNNPGYSGIGVIICDHWGRRIKEISEYIGIATLCQSEFHALLRGIEEVRSMNAFKVKIFSDYEPLIKHMIGIFKLKDNELTALLEQIKALSKGLHMEFSQIHPQKNREADKLCRDAVEKKLAEVKAKPEKPKEIRKKDIDVTAIRAAVQRALLFEEIVKERAEPEAEVVKKEASAPGREEVAEKRAALQDFMHEGAILDEDGSLDEREERQISAGGVVYKKEGHRIKVCLVGKKSGRVWALPKGRLNPGENPEETAKREIAEETGHLTEVKEKIDEINYYFYWKEASVLYHKTVYFYLMPLVQEDYCQRDQEVDKLVWLTLGEAYQKLTYLNEKEILKKARKLLVAK